MSISLDTRTLYFLSFLSGGSQLILLSNIYFLKDLSLVKSPFLLEFTGHWTRVVYFYYGGETDFEFVNICFKGFSNHCCGSSPAGNLATLGAT